MLLLHDGVFESTPLIGDLYDFFFRGYNRFRKCRKCYFIYNMVGHMVFVHLIKRRQFRLIFLTFVWHFYPGIGAKVLPEVIDSTTVRHFSRLHSLPFLVSFVLYNMRSYKPSYRSLYTLAAFSSCFTFTPSVPEARTSVQPRLHQYYSSSAFY